MRNWIQGPHRTLGWVLAAAGLFLVLAGDSALAGFVEPGESLEEAVAREVREEAGVEVGPPAYVASQPWPFPSSLMLGFTAPWVAGEPRRIDDELADVRWFDRADIAAAAEEREAPLGLPPRFAIARRLLEAWLQR